jgi:hypothetical protein
VLRIGGFVAPAPIAAVIFFTAARCHGGRNGISGLIFRTRINSRSVWATTASHKASIIISSISYWVSM